MCAMLSTEAKNIVEPEKLREEEKRLAALSPEENLAAWEAAVRELYQIQGFDDPQMAIQHCLAKERALLAHAKFSRNIQAPE
jgi:hypothetical protein